MFDTSFALVQAEMIMGITADQLAELRSNDEEAYKAALSNAQWAEWRMTVQTKGHEYKGERKMRHQVGAGSDQFVFRCFRSGVHAQGSSQALRKHLFQTASFTAPFS